MLKLIEEYNKAGKVIEESLRQYVQDKTIPLKDRWNCFCAAEMGETERWIYEGFGKRYFGYEAKGYHCERYETILLTEAIDHEFEVSEVINEEDTDEDGFFILTPKAQEKIDKMKEQVLKDFVWSFKYDW